MKTPVIDSYLAIYETVEKELKEVKLLTGIVGIGVYSALIIYSEIGDCSRFSNEKEERGKRCSNSSSSEKTPSGGLPPC